MKNKRLIIPVILTILFSVLLSSSMNAQKMYMQDGIVFEQYDYEYGLSHNNILSLIKDSKGFLWTGTVSGVNILDGKELKIFKGYLNEGNTFKGKVIFSIFEDSKGNVLCGTEKFGLNIFNRTSRLFVNINEPLLSSAKSKSIRSITEISESKYAILTEKEIIYFQLDDNFDVSNISRIKISLQEKEYTRKLLFYNNTLFVNTSKRLIKTTATSQIAIFSNKWLKDCKVRNDRLWVITDDKIGYLTKKDLNEVNWIDYTFTKNKENKLDYYLDFDVSTKNEIWIGAKHQLIYLKLGKNDKVKKSQQIESKVDLKKILIDATGNVFISAHKQGLIKIDGRQHQYDYIKLPKGYENERRYSFTEDNQGHYWIGGKTGIFAYNTKTNTYRKFNNGSYKGLSNRKINHQIKSKNGKIWIGTSNGIAEYNTEKNDFNFYGHNLENYWDSFAYHLQTDSKQNLWYVTKNRLNRLDYATKSHSFFEIEKIAAIFIDSSNTLWVTDGNKGLVKYNIDSGKPIAEKEFFIYKDFLDNNTLGIIDDKYGRLWIHTVNGIYVYDPNSEEIVFHANRNNILKHERLFKITPDNRGNFWVAQYKNPSICISAETFEIVELSPLWMRHEGNIDVYAGPSGIEKSGKIFMEGTGGFFVYGSDSLIINPNPPHFTLHKLKINGQTTFDNFLGAYNLNFDQLNYDENNIEVGLKAINPENSYTTEYAYRLIGNSEQWLYTKELKTINYNGLQPNLYQLQVKSTNNGKDWSPPLTLASFNIQPPWWKTTLAYIIYLILFTAIIYAFYKIQLNKKLAVSEANQLKQIDDFKNKFYQNITHEFRTPLTVIIGMMESLESKASKMVKRNAQQLLNLVNELLEIGKIESNSANLELSTKDIVDFTKYSMESLESLANNKEINLKFNSNLNSILIDFDTDKMQLVLNNLLSNAIKFTPKNGLIEVSVKALGQVIEIKVKDSGSGISQDNLEKIFDRYFQEKNNKSAKGSGLGLALSRELVKLMDGTIKATNNEDLGACFTVTLPLKNNDLKFKDYQPKITNYDLPITIENDENVVLVIEDNEDVLSYIISVLEPSYAVCSAPNGKLGFEKALELIPDLIISDVMMPIMNGYEACHLIKSDFRTNHIPVVMLTAKVDYDSKMSGLKLGADVYLGKPFNKEELLVHINNLISTRENLKKKYNSENSNLNNTQTPKISNEFLSKVSEVLLNNISDDTFGINEICKEIGVSRTQLHRKLKALTGLSTSKFIREIRLNEGYKLIKNTELGISEIAYSIGFIDPNYFSTLFKEKFKTPPSKINE